MADAICRTTDQSACAMETADRPVTGLVYASGWDGHAFPTWPVRPPAPCGICGQPGRPYLAGARCDNHRPGGPVPPVYPLSQTAGTGARALDHARERWPAAPACAPAGDRPRPACPYPLDPANGDHPQHVCCDPAAQRDLAAARHADARRRSAAARAAAKGAAA